MSCYQKGATVWDTGLRRVVVVEDSSCADYGTAYEIQTVDGTHSSEAGCCDLRRLDDTDEGRHNRRVVEKIEKLLGTLR